MSTSPARFEVSSAPDLRGGRRGWVRFAPGVSWTATCLAVDGLMLAAGAATAAFGSRAAGVPSPSLGWLILFPPLVVSLLAARGAYTPRLRLQILDDLRLAVVATSVATTALISLRVLATGDPNIAAQSVRQWLFATAYLAAGRTGLLLAQVRARRRGEDVQPTLIIGAGKIGQLTAQRLAEQPELGLKPVGFLDKEPLDDGRNTAGLPVLGASWDLTDVISRYGVKHVILAFSTAPHAVMLDIVRRCEALGVALSSVPRLFEKVQRDVTVEHLGGLPLISLRSADPKGWKFAIKYGLDRVIAAVSLLLALPVLLVTALAVWISVGRPILFSQERVGRDGRMFSILKFRSMKHAPRSEEAFDPSVLLPAGRAPGGVEGADRRTRTGAILRKTSIDELPQLLNVLKGEMSLIGPRPERPEFVELFEQQIYRYQERHRVKSGITGWAQIHGLRGNTSLADRVEWDNYYIQNWSFWLDVKIVLMTFVAIFRSKEVE